MILMAILLGFSIDCLAQGTVTRSRQGSAKVTRTTGNKTQKATKKLSPEEMKSKAMSMIDDGEYNSAIPLLTEVAEKGSGDCAYILGDILQNGKGGVTRNIPQAIYWHEIAAAAGNADAMNALGKIYEKSIGLPDGGHGKEQALVWYKKAAEAGKVDALFNIGLLYFNGNTVTKNYGEAKNWFDKASDKGHVEAMVYSGDINYEGMGQSIDFAKAFMSYKMAANKGNAKAMYRLGEMYEYGRGVRSDGYESLNWYNASAERNYSDAYYRLGTIYKYGMIGVSKNLSKALECYETASRLGHAGAMHSLAELYYNGNGVRQDKYKAHELWKKAAQLGISNAREALAKYF